MASCGADGKKDLGRLVPGYCGDCAVSGRRSLCKRCGKILLMRFLNCHSCGVSDLVVGGIVRVRDGWIKGLDLGRLQAAHAKRSSEIHKSVI